MHIGAIALGLRERQRKATEDKIRRTAVQLVRIHGLDEVTVEMISAEAMVSQRTFFNYFAYKEAALIMPPPAFPEHAIGDFVNGTGPFLDDLIELFSAQIEMIGADREMLRHMFEMAREHPKLLVLLISAFHEFDAMVANVIARRLGLPREHERPTLIAAISAAAVRLAMKRWVRNSETSAVFEVRRTLQSLPSIFDEQDVSQNVFNEIDVLSAVGR